MKRYVVKIRRFYQGRESTSVLTVPLSKKEAENEKDRRNTMYQSTQYYVEEWVK